MEIVIVRTITDEIFRAIIRLLPQLTDSTETPVPSKEYLQTMINSGVTTLFIVRENDKILGMLSLVIYFTSLGKKSWIEDVVTDAEARGKGVAKLLIDTALDFAKKEGIEKVDLTSSNQRTAAHKLYEKAGFKKRDTTVFRIQLNK